VKHSGGRFSAAGCANSALTSAWNKNYIWADMGINQFVSRPSNQVDKMPYRYWMTSFATTSSADVTTNSGCASCPGYTSAFNMASNVDRRTCPTTCALLRDEFGNGYMNNANAVFMTNRDSVMATGFAYNDRTYYSFTQTSGNPGCTDYVSNFPAPAGGASYTLTNSGTAAWVFTGSGLSGAQNPTLTVSRGDVISFTNNAASSAHFFSIKTAQGTGAANRFDTGVTGVGNGQSAGTLVWTVPASAPAVLFYQCEAHAPMVGLINVRSGAGMVTPTLSLLLLAVSIVSAALRV